MSPSDKLGALQYLGEIWNHGAFVAFLVALLASPIMMHVLAMTMERRTLWPPQSQYVSFFYGDIALAASVGLIAYMVPKLHGDWFRSGWWQWGSLIFGVLFGWGQLVMEKQGGAYTNRQFLSPTKLWHNLAIFPLLGYWLASGGFAVTFSAHVSPVVKIIAWIGPIIWLAGAVYDVSHKKPKAHVDFDWRAFFSGSPQRYNWNSDPVS